MTADATAPTGRSRAAGTAGTLAGQLMMHTAEEAASLLKVKRSWLERQAAARQIPFSMLGGSYRFSDRHLAEIVRMNEVAPVPPAPDAPPPARSSRKMRPGEPTPTVAPLRPRPRNGPRRT
ncbi:MAG TPA: helix-turn-helix domain-containing protein [Streptosporangiaceae bacterium]